MATHHQLHGENTWNCERICRDVSQPSFGSILSTQAADQKRHIKHDHQEGNSNPLTAVSARTAAYPQCRLGLATPRKARNSANRRKSRRSAGMGRDCDDDGCRPGGHVCGREPQCRNLRIEGNRFHHSRVDLTHDTKATSLLDTAIVRAVRVTSSSVVKMVTITLGFQVYQLSV